MNADDYLDNEVQGEVQRYENMLRNKTQEYFDSETLEEICEFYISKEKLKNALEVIYFSEDLYPNHSGLSILKVEIFIGLEKYAEALELIKTLEIYEPTNDNLFLLKGAALLNLGFEQDARDCFEQALDYTDERLDMLFQLGYIHEDSKRYQQALYYFDLIIAEDPKSEQAYFDAANTSNLMGNTQLSINYINKLIDTNPYHADAWFFLGMVHSKQKEHEKAIEAFEYCLAIDDKYEFARFNKANELTELGQHKAAIEEYKASLNPSQPDAITLCNIAGCHERLDEDILAAFYYNQAVKIDPQLAEAWYGIGLTLEKHKRYQEASAYFTKAVMLDKTNVEYVLSLAETIYRLDNAEEAIGLYSDLTEIDPSCMEAWLDWSFILFAQDKFDAAIGVLQHGIDANPDHYMAHYRMVCYLYAAGKQQQAYHHLETALGLNKHEFYLMFEIMPELQDVKQITDLIELYSKENDEKL